jgi:hypothetical protein
MTCRTPAGHPEGYLEAFANIYRGFMNDVRRVQRDEAPLRDYPGVRDGLRGLRFISQAVASSSAGGVWLDLEVARLLPLQRSGGSGRGAQFCIQRIRIFVLEERENLRRAAPRLCRGMITRAISP